MINENQSQGDIHIGDDATIDGDVFTGGKHTHYHYSRPQVGTPFQAPALPAHFVPRPDIADMLKARLLTQTTTAPGMLAVSALHGLGGIGKSTLAAALAYDSEVQQRFNDGVLWTTLGQQPDLLSLLSGWVQALGDRDFRPTTVETTSTHLRSLLQDKAALLVIDDVWDPAHLFIWQVGGPYSRTLITTRRADVAEEVGAELHQLDVMTKAQSLELLSTRLGRSLEGPEQTEALNLAAAVGHLPLALELAAARVSRGTSWATLCQALEEEVAHLEALESARRRRGKGDTQLEASFNLSLNALKTYDEQAYQAFIWLGILSEDALVAAPVAATLWDVSETDAVDILELLWNDALLRSSTSMLIGETSWSTYQLHDLLREVARRLLIAPKPQGLGLDLPTAHARFLQNYRQRCHNEQWHTLSPDGYIQTRLTWHMIQAKQAYHIYNLLDEETTDSRNGWYQMCESTGHIANFLKDVNTAWHLADTVWTEERFPEALSRQCRYALINASLNSLAKNIPPALLAALVQKEVWNPDQGLAYARQIPNIQQRIDALLQLVPHLPESMHTDTLKETLLAVQTLADSAEQVDFLKKLFPLLVQTGHLKEVLGAVKSVTSGPNQAAALVALAPHLTPLFLEETLSIAATIKPVSERTKALVKLIPYLSDPLLHQVFDIAQSIPSGRERADILIALTPRMPEANLVDILVATEAIEQSTERARVLVSLAPYLSEPLLDQALAMVEQIQRSADQVLALTGIFPRLAALGHPDEALIIINRLYTPDVQDIVFLGSQDRLSAGRITDHLYTAEDQDTILLALVPQLVALDYLDEALQAAQAINDSRQRAKTLADLTGHFAGVIIPEQIIDIASKIEHSHHKATALLGVVPHLSDPAKLDTLLEVRASLHHDIWDPKERAITLVNLTSQLAAAGHQQEAIDLARSIELDHYRAETLMGIAPHLLASHRREIYLEALAAALNIQNVEMCIETLLALSLQMPESLREDILNEAVNLCRTIQNQHTRVQILTRLVSHLAKAGYVEKALTEVQMVRWSDTLLARLLGSLAPYLPEALLPDALTLVWTIKLRSNRTEALTGLVPYLPAPLLEEALASVRAIDDRSRCIQALAGLAPWLAELGPPDDVLAAIQAVGRINEQTLLLTQLLPKLAQRGYPYEALTAAQSIQAPNKRLETLIDLAPHLPNNLHRQVVQALRQTVQVFDDKAIQADTLTELSLLLAELGYPQDALEVVQVADNAYDRAGILANLSSWLAQLGYTDEAIIAARATGSYGDLINLLEYLVEPQRSEVFEEILSLIQVIDDKEEQVQVLIDFTDWLAASNDIEAALQVTQTIQWSTHQALVLAELSPCLSETLLTERAIPMAQAIEQSEDQARALIGLLPRLAELGYPESALKQAQKISDESWQVQVLAALIPQLPEALLVEVYPTIHEIEHQFWRHKVIVPFVARLAELGWTDDALTVIADIQDTDTKAQALAQIPVPLAKLDQIEEALAWVQEIEIEHWRIQAILALAPELLVAGYPEEALTVVWEIGHKVDREAALMQLTGQLAVAGYAREALLAAQMIEDDQQRFEALTQVAQQLAEADNTEVTQEAIQAIDDFDKRITVLTELTSYFPDEVKETTLHQALAMAIAIESGEDRFEALSRLVPQLATLPPETLRRIWLNTDQDISLLHTLAKRTRQDLLSDLLTLEPIIAKLGGAEAIGETFCAILEVGRWWP